MYESKFLHLRYKPDMESNFQLDEDFKYRLPDGSLLTVPAYFKTDLASIPAIARPMFPVHGRYTVAAVVHDYLYQCRGDVIARDKEGTRAHLSYTRQWADEIFHKALLEAGVDKTDAKLMYWAVRVG